MTTPEEKKEKKCVYCNKPATVGDLCDECGYLQAESETIKMEIYD